MALVTALSSCSTDVLVDDSFEASKPSGSVQTTSSYQKPGAAVQFEHSYDGSTAIGEIEEIQLQFKEQYDAGVLTITLDPQGDLLVDSGALSESFSLQGDEPLLIDIGLSAEAVGRHYLHIFATVTGLDGNEQTRAFAMSLKVGDETVLNNQKATVEETSNGEPIILLPAVEAIIQ